VSWNGLISFACPNFKLVVADQTFISSHYALEEVIALLYNWKHFLVGVHEAFS
jgi:hypothetical protein